MEQKLGTLIMNARKARSESQEKLAEKVEKTKHWVGSIERGNVLPTLDLLMRIHAELVPKDHQDPSLDLKTWLLCWLEKKVDDDAIAGKDSALTAINQLFEQASQTRRRPTSGVPTLADFPDGFENLVIVCGDRRESPPKSKGDFFVDDFSSADLASLKTLFQKTGPLEIRSDKLFQSGNLSSIDYLKQIYGRSNLIVIGSPAVNLVARSINRTSVFRFAASKAVRDFVRYWEEEIPEVNDRKLRDIFWDMASKWNGSPETSDIDPAIYYQEYKNRGLAIHEGQIEELARKVGELLKSNTVKYVKSSFHKFGFFDPIANKMQGFFLREDNDFGVISLCPNPYADGADYFCILAAGIHGPGTDMAVRVLGKGDFKGHPLGGVIEVKLDLEARWSERFSSADFDWQTEEYTVDEALLRRLRNPNPDSILGKWEPGDLKHLTDFVQRFVRNNAQAKASAQL